MNNQIYENLLKAIVEPLSKRINQSEIEQWAASLWKLSPSDSRPSSGPSTRKPFVMMFPPPNITGNLHLGHALTGAIQDALIRHRRMRGDHCVFIPGFDHAGLSTQNIVEKLAWKTKGLTRQQLGREKFLELANEWKVSKQAEMRDQLNRLGLDLSHEREYFTMDNQSSSAVHTAFKQLFTSGLIYRSLKPIFWSDELQTTLSDIEVDKVDGVNRYSRTGEIVEKRQLSQWFIDAKAMAREAVRVVEDGSIDVIPTAYKRSWSSWLTENGVQDWCISRQSWWGHRIPAYRMSKSEDVKDNWVVADSLSDARLLLGQTDGVVQDPDVLDTWFSSSLLPLTVSGWPDPQKFANSCLEQHFPLHIMETGFDILTFWVSKMTMISLALTNRIPFKLILLHGMICDSDGKKMSKSRGNVIDPLDVIDGASLENLQRRAKGAHAQGIIDEGSLTNVLDNQKRLFPQGIPACGADGLRSYLLSHDFQEEVVRVQIEQIDKIRRLSNKIWNVFRFLYLLIDDEKAIDRDQFPLKMDPTKIDRSKLDEYDQQVLSRMCKCVESAQKEFNGTYNLYLPLHLLESFFVVDLSKNYLATCRDTLMGQKGTKEDRLHKLEVLGTCLLASTKLLHPFMPHITEFLYQKLVFLNLKRQSPTQAVPVPPLGTVLLSHQEFPDLESWSKFACNQTEVSA